MVLKTTDTVSLLARARFTPKHGIPARTKGLGPETPRCVSPVPAGPPHILTHLQSPRVSGQFPRVTCIPVAGLTSHPTTPHGCGFDRTLSFPRLRSLQRTWAQRTQASTGVAARSLSSRLQLLALPNCWRMAVLRGAVQESCKPQLVPLESHPALEKAI